MTAKRQSCQRIRAPPGGREQPGRAPFILKPSPARTLRWLLASVRGTVASRSGWGGGPRDAILLVLQLRLCKIIQTANVRSALPDQAIVRQRISPPFKQSRPAHGRISYPKAAGLYEACGSRVTRREFVGTLLRQLHLVQERLVAGIRFEILEQPISLDEKKTRILLRVGAIEPPECLIDLAPVCMCLRNAEGIVARMFASEGGELGIGVRLAAESVVDKDQSLRSFMRCLLYYL